MLALLCELFDGICPNMPLIKVSVKRKYIANMQIIFQSKGSTYIANMQVKEVMKPMQIAKPTYVKKSTYTLESIKLTPLQLQPKCKARITHYLTSNYSSKV